MSPLNGLLQRNAPAAFHGNVVKSKESETMMRQLVMMKAPVQQMVRALGVRSVQPQLVRALGSAPEVHVKEMVAVQDSSGEHLLKNLNVEMVRRIKSELIEADTNADGRIHSDELKALLKKHKNFSDKEIEELGELFYSSKAGGSVSFDRFIHAIDVAIDTEEDKNIHFKTSQIDHPLGVGKCSTEYLQGGHPVYSEEDLDVKLTHTPPVTMSDKAALQTVKLLRKGFDFFTGWNVGELTTSKIMLRGIFLETIAAVPGFVAAIFRHFRALRTMQRDGGWTNLLLEEAENEKLHLLTMIRMYEPGTLFRYAVVVGQIGFATFFGIAYALNPAFCHRLVGYIEEEACSTYTKIINAIEHAPADSDLAKWQTAIAPAIGRSYWHLGETGTILDLIKAIRADEANHRDVNHLAAGVRPGQINPFLDPAAKLDTMLLKYVNDIMSVGRPDNKNVAL